MRPLRSLSISRRLLIAPARPLFDFYATSLVALIAANVDQHLHLAHLVEQPLSRRINLRRIRRGASRRQLCQSIVGKI